MSKLAHLIAQEEGYGIPDALPTRNNNPGDLRHSPHSFHKPGDPNSIGEIDTPEDGWADLERQLQLYAERGMSLREAIYEFAPPSENNTVGYLNYVLGGLGVTNPDMPISQALEIT
jgi:hypothetical protein